MRTDSSMKATIAPTLMMLVSISAVAGAQVQVRVGVPGRATYSELHEALRNGTPAADSVKIILRAKAPAPLWRQLGRTIDGQGDWNSALLSLTRLAELRSAAYADSAARILRFLESGGSVPFPSDPGLKPEDLEPSLQAIVLERRRAVKGDSAVLADILARVPSRKYNHGDAWVLGLLWVGTKEAMEALLKARSDARAAKTYADSSLARGGYDFLANDSSTVISRTGRWLTEWIATLGPRPSSTR